MSKSELIEVITKMLVECDQVKLKPFFVYLKITSQPAFDNFQKEIPLLGEVSNFVAHGSQSPDCRLCHSIENISTNHKPTQTPTQKRIQPNPPHQNVDMFLPG
jgi:hypothetical protein